MTQKKPGDICESDINPKDDQTNCNKKIFKIDHEDDEIVQSDQKRLEK